MYSCLLVYLLDLKFSVHYFHVLVVSAYRYIAITTLAIIAVFLEYLRQFLIDLHQIHRRSSVLKTRLREFLELFSSSGFRAWHRRDFFFVTLCLSWSSESLDCLTFAEFGLINVFSVRRNARRLQIEIFLSWAYSQT